MPGEELLHFIWRSGYYLNQDLKTACGKIFQVLSQGEPNSHAGPDFLNARVRIGGLLWTGNVEIHDRSSDWVRHGHHSDPAYNNVILHVVRTAEGPVYNNMGRRIPEFELDLPPSLLSYYSTLQSEESWLHCRHFIRDIPNLEIKSWLTRLGAERLAFKTHHCSTLINVNLSNCDASLWRALASGFGLPANRLPFEMTLSSVPYDILFQCRDSIQDLEGILFGQAGFLKSASTLGPYARDLFKRHRYFRNRLCDSQVESHYWRFLRLRPASFPTIRLSQFAFLIHKQLPLVDQLLEVRSMIEMEQLMNIQASDYWETHYRFGKHSPVMTKALGYQSMRTILLNAIVPFLMAFGRIHAHDRAIGLGTLILNEMKAESNHIIKRWAQYGIIPENAFESQALIHLHNEYCNKKRCQECRIGIWIILRPDGQESGLLFQKK
jgi:hypothetical protein